MFLCPVRQPGPQTLLIDMYKFVYDHPDRCCACSSFRAACMRGSAGVSFLFDVQLYVLSVCLASLTDFQIRKGKFPRETADVLPMLARHL